MFIKFLVVTTSLVAIIIGNVAVAVVCLVVDDLSSVLAELSIVVLSSNVVVKVKPTVELEEEVTPEVGVFGVVFSRELVLIVVLVVTISPLFVEGVALVTSAPVVVFDTLKLSDVISKPVVEDITFTVVFISLNVVGISVVATASSMSGVV